MSIKWKGRVSYIGGGGGGDVSIDPRRPPQEKKTIGNWYNFQENRYGDFRNQDPLLSTSTADALRFGQQLPTLTAPLAALQSQAPGFYSATQSKLRDITGRLQGDFTNVFQPAIQNPYTPEVGRLGSQSARIASAAAGMAHSPGAIASEVLNRQDVLDKRRALYTQLGTGVAGQAANMIGQQAGIFGQQGALESALAQGQQGLQTGSLNQRLGVGNAAVSQFSGLTNPILSYLGNLFQGNLQSRIAGAQIGAQEDIAGQNKGSGLASGAVSLIGSVAAAY